MIEAFEALEKYTVVQLAFAVPVLLIVWMIVRELRMVVNKPPQPDGDNAIDTTKILAETLGGIIANELQKIDKSVREDQQTNTEEHQGIVGALNKHGEIMERVAIIITEHNDKSEAFRETIGGLVGQLTGDLVKTNEAVEVMNTDIEQIKRDLETVKSAVNNIEQRIGQAIPLDPESLATMSKFIECAKTLEEQLSKVTQEAPATSKPKTPGVPVTPKPTDTEEPKEENKS